MIYRMLHKEISAQRKGGYYNVANRDQQLANYYILFPYQLTKEYPSSILETIGPTSLVEWQDD